MKLNRWIIRMRYRRAYIKAIREANHLDCGHNLALKISMSYYNKCQKFNKLADKLSKYDEDPGFRFRLN